MLFYSILLLFASNLFAMEKEKRDRSCSPSSNGHEISSGSISPIVRIPSDDGVDNNEDDTEQKKICEYCMQPKDKRAGNTIIDVVIAGFCNVEKETNTDNDQRTDKSLGTSCNDLVFAETIAKNMKNFVRSALKKWKKNVIKIKTAEEQNKRKQLVKFEPQNVLTRTNKFIVVEREFVWHMVNSLVFVWIHKNLSGISAREFFIIPRIESNASGGWHEFLHHAKHCKTLTELCVVSYTTFPISFAQGTGLFQSLLAAVMYANFWSWLNKPQVPRSAKYIVLNLLYLILAYQIFKEYF